jgi:hypothetical protein
METNCVAPGPGTQESPKCPAEDRARSAAEFSSGVGGDRSLEATSKGLLASSRQDLRFFGSMEKFLFFIDGAAIFRTAPPAGMLLNTHGAPHVE